MRICRIDLPKERLQELSSSERSLFLLLGYASNQINALRKLIVVATNEGPTDPVEAKVSAAQTQIFVRLLIGVMREALKLIERRFVGDLLRKEYVPRLSADASAALDRLYDEGLGLLLDPPRRSVSSAGCCHAADRRTKQEQGQSAVHPAAATRLSCRLAYLCADAVCNA
jgi:hypothetical protein